MKYKQIRSDNSKRKPYQQKMCVHHRRKKKKKKKKKPRNRGHATTLVTCDPS